MKKKRPDGDYRRVAKGEAPVFRRVWAVSWIAVILAAIPNSSEAQDCMRWTNRTDVSSLGERTFHAMAYDTTRGVTVSFGGEIGTTGNETYYDEAHEYDGVRWRRIEVVGPKPAARSFATMAYDGNRMILHGGFKGGVGDLAFSDTWAYTSDGTNGFWVDLKANGGSRAGARMAYDSANSRILLHGGISVPFSEFTRIPQRTTVFWTGSNWQVLSENGPGVWGFGAAFDNARGTFMTIGGFAEANEQGLRAEHWELRGNTWTDLGSPIPGRGHPGMAYDSKRGRTVVVGGVSGQQGFQTGKNVYSFVPGKGWIALPQFPGTGRGGMGFVYDSKRDKFVLFGGVGGLANGARHADTWELEPVPLVPPQILGPSSVTNCAAESRTFAATWPQGAPARPVTYQWYWKARSAAGPQLLSNATNQTLLLTNLTEFQEGSYSVVWTDLCGNTATSAPAMLEVHTRPLIAPPTRHHSEVHLSWRRCDFLGDCAIRTAGQISVVQGQPGAVERTIQFLHLAEL